MTITLTRIISGGQTGADQGALAAAKELGLKTGGWAPRDYRTDDGNNRALLRDTYNLIEHESREYPPRTEMNVRYAGGTLIFGNTKSPGCILTERLCFQSGRDIFWVSWDSSIPIPPTEPFSDWVKGRSWDTLNVAGNRERINPGIYNAARTFLITALKDLI